jgi:hypothetical protein
MYKSLKWSPKSALTSVSLNQMVENDKDNYLLCASSAGSIVAISQMTQRFETMPGNNPTRIPYLSVDAFRAPYTGWYKAHFSCAAARQDTTNIDGSNAAVGTSGQGRSALSYLDGFYFVITAKHTNTLVRNEQFSQDNESLFEVGQLRGSPAIGSVIARASFVISGQSVPVAATGYKWLNKGESVAWDVYTYVANNNKDLLTSANRNYGRIVMNSRQASSIAMGYGSPRMYKYGGAAGTSATVPTSAIDYPAAPATNDYKTISSIIAPNDDSNRSSYLAIQFAGQGGVPGVGVAASLEKDLNIEVIFGETGTAYEV